MKETRIDRSKQKQEEEGKRRRSHVEDTQSQLVTHKGDTGLILIKISQAMKFPVSQN